MKIYILFLFANVLLFSFCKNENNTSSAPSTATTSPNASDEAKKLEESKMDFWTKNNCTRSIPKPIANEAQRSEGYTFELDKIRGQGIEILTFDKGDELTIVNKGCESIWLVYKFSLNSEVHQVDMSDKLEVSKKLLSLIDFATKLSTPPLDIKGRLPMLGQVIDQIGPFEMGQEFLFSNEEIKEGFTLDKAEERNGKILLDFSFSMGPL